MASPTCDQCGGTSAGPFRCSECGAFLVPDPTRDHFQTLGLPPRPDVDPFALEEAFEALCRQLHPDHAGTQPGARARAVLHTAQVNDAWGVLRDPFRRLEYLLRLRGGSSADQDKSVPEGFLEEMMERRMHLQEVAERKDPEQLSTTRQDLQQALERALDPLQQWLAPESGDDFLVLARRQLNMASYLRGMLRDLKDGRA